MITISKYLLITYNEALHKITTDTFSTLEEAKQAMNESFSKYFGYDALKDNKAELNDMDAYILCRKKQSDTTWYDNFVWKIIEI